MTGNHCRATGWLLAGAIAFPAAPALANSAAAVESLSAPRTGMVVNLAAPRGGEDEFVRLFGLWQALDYSNPVGFSDDAPDDGPDNGPDNGDAPVGRKIYYNRSKVAGSLMVVSFSDHPFPVARSRLTRSGMPQSLSRGGAHGAMPSGLPVQAVALTSGFGMRTHPILGTQRGHYGVDLAAPMGSPIYATSAGVVALAGWNGGYGLVVALDHGGGLETRFGHMSRIAVAPGQRVSKGQVIGYVGSTGLSTGPHVHYEVRIDGRPVNPLP